MPHSFAGDPHRPQFHFLPPANWMNDPNGLIHWQGKFHLFYQHNPNGPFWGTMHWGHAVSPDLVHWMHQPIAMTPTPGGPDSGGVFSGCAVEDTGTPTFLYTAVWPETQCLAIGSGDLSELQKYPGNPVIARPPEGLDVEGFRDPCVWKEQDAWYMVVGSGIRGAGGAVLLYRSPNLRDWEYLQPVLTGDARQDQPFPTGDMWECPSLFRIGDRWALILSALDTHQIGPLYTVYFTGKYEDRCFQPELLAKFDHSGHLFYAPQTFLDDQGRRLLFGWIQESRSDPAQRLAGWSGVMSLPRVLSLLPGGKLGMETAPELQTLRREHFHTGGLALAAGSRVSLHEAGGNQLELLLALQPYETGGFELELCASPEGEEKTVLRFDGASATLSLDTTLASMDPQAFGTVSSCPLDLPAGEPLRLHIYLDHSVLEVIANEYASLTARLYPSLPSSLETSLRATGDGAGLIALDVWKMASIWNED